MPNFVVYNLNQFLVLFLILFKLNNVYSEIIVYKNTSSDKIVRVITDYELSIGSDIPDDGIMAYIVVAEPENACTEIKPPPKDPFKTYSNDTKLNWFVLIDRDYCVMSNKLSNVKNAGYNGVIIYDARLTQTNLPEIDYKLVVDFPVLLVTHIDGRQIKSFYTYEKGYFAWFLNNSPFKLFPYLIPFLFVIGACIIVIISFMISQIIRCYNERKKRRRHRLAKRHLKKIPTINFKKGDHYEICAICLDEFTEGVKLRLLTCGHAYHLKCIDPWLTENRRNCPICKGKVVVPGITDSESENEAENERNNNATERTPLISGGGSSSNSQQNNNDLIFPIGRRTRRSGRISALSNQNNVPSTSNISQNNNDLVINVVQPNESTRSTNRFIQFLNRRTENLGRFIINAEINSPQSPLIEEQPTTSSSVNDNESINSNVNRISSGNMSTVTNISNNNSNNSNISTTSQSSNNYGSTSTSNISRPKSNKREDNIV